MKLINRVKYGIPAGIGAAMVAVTPVFAEGANAEVVAAFTGAADEVKATVLAIAGVAVGILVIMYAFKWGKKIFNRVAG